MYLELKCRHQLPHFYSQINLRERLKRSKGLVRGSCWIVVTWCWMTMASFWDPIAWFITRQFCTTRATIGMNGNNISWRSCSLLPLRVVGLTWKQPVLTDTIESSSPEVNPLEPGARLVSLTSSSVSSRPMVVAVPTLPEGHYSFHEQRRLT